MDLTKDTIKHYRSAMIPTDILKKMVKLNTKDLKEKPTWYQIDGKLQFFKVRDDLRLFTELFFRKFAESIMDLESLEYNLACVRTISPIGRRALEKSEYGLLSKSFQDLSYNHYLASELMEPHISDFVSYSDGYSLTSLLNYFQNILAPLDYEKVRLFLIRLFIADGFTLQLDRNPHNISFKIPEIEGIEYDDRLRPNNLVDLPDRDKYLENSDGIYKLKGFEPNCVFDSERSIWIDHKKIKKFGEGIAWYPSFPYNDEVLFDTGEEAYEASVKSFDGLDPNLFYLYIEYQDLCKPYFERLAYDDEYRKILEGFSSRPSPVVLSNDELKYVESILKDRQEEMKRILKI